MLERLLIVVGLVLATSLRADELQPTPALPVVIEKGQAVWTARDGMSFAVPPGLRTTGTLYARVIYLDRGEGLLTLSYPTAHGMAASVRHTRSSRVNTGKFVASYHELPGPVFGPQGAAHLRLDLRGGGGVPLEVRNVTVEDKPFRDADFEQALSALWRLPLHFTPTDSAPAKSLRDRVMVGYQGWFRTPNDRDDRGWVHWFRSPTAAAPADYTFDMWPDTRQYPARDRIPAGGIETRSGRTASLFSSTSEAVVRRHFAWMRQNDIDGAFLQRFLTKRKGGDDGTPEWTLLAVRKAADAERRLWAVEYDVSGMPPATAYAALRRDWTWLHDTLKITEDPYYAHEGGKPVVFVWGLPFPDRGFRPETADRIIRFFKSDSQYGGNYVIGSLPNEWQHLSPAWLAHARRYDGVQVWQSHDYAVDKTACDRWGLDYYPHVWPGFSWAHLTRKQEPAAFTDRAGGKFYRSQINRALAAGCDRLFVGMFDEYDEGTAIAPMSDDPPPPGPPAGRFLTNGDDSPKLWLRITAQADRALKTHSPLKD